MSVARLPGERTVSANKAKRFLMWATDALGSVCDRAEGRRGAADIAAELEQVENAQTLLAHASDRLAQVKARLAVEKRRLGEQS